MLRSNFSMVSVPFPLDGPRPPGGSNSLVSAPKGLFFGPGLVGLGLQRHRPQRGAQSVAHRLGGKVDGKLRVEGGGLRLPLGGGAASQLPLQRGQKRLGPALPFPLGPGQLRRRGQAAAGGPLFQQPLLLPALAPQPVQLCADGGGSRPFRSRSRLCSRAYSFSSSPSFTAKGPCVSIFDSRPFCARCALFPLYQHRAQKTTLNSGDMYIQTPGECKAVLHSPGVCLYKIFPNVPPAHSPVSCRFISPLTMRSMRSTSTSSSTSPAQPYFRMTPIRP